MEGVEVAESFLEGRGEFDDEDSEVTFTLLVIPALAGDGAGTSTGFLDDVDRTFSLELARSGLFGTATEFNLANLFALI